MPETPETSETKAVHWINLSKVGFTEGQLQIEGETDSLCKNNLISCYVQMKLRIDL